MTYFPDLSRYSYFPTEKSLINIGWLGRDIPFPIGSVHSSVRDILIVLAADPKTMARGMHDCEFCNLESPIKVLHPQTGSPVLLGFAEIHVVSEPGLLYSAPNLIIHYIDAHRYLPPADFLKAVLAEAPRGRLI